MTIRSALGAGFVTVAILGISLLTPLTASAELITFTHTGASGSGSIGGNPFSNQPFTITAIGDTLNRQSFPGVIFSTEHDTASIAIDGVGVFTFLTPTRTFFNGNTVGFSRGNAIGGGDLYNGPSNAALFAGWDMLSSIGPISGQTTLLQWTSFSPVITSGGQLIFSDAQTTGSFHAQVIPEPSTMTLFAIAGLLTVTRHLVRRLTCPRKAVGMAPHGTWRTMESHAGSLSAATARFCATR